MRGLETYVALRPAAVLHDAPVHPHLQVRLELRLLVLVEVVGLGPHKLPHDVLPHAVALLLLPLLPDLPQPPELARRLLVQRHLLGRGVRVAAAAAPPAGRPVEPPERLGRRRQRRAGRGLPLGGAPAAAGAGLAARVPLDHDGRGAGEAAGGQPGDGHDVAPVRAGRGLLQDGRHGGVGARREGPVGVVAADVGQAAVAVVHPAAQVAVVRGHAVRLLPHGHAAGRAVVAKVGVCLWWGEGLLLPGGVVVDVEHVVRRV